MKNFKIDLDRQLLFEILENIYNEVYVVDKNMNIIYVNPACLRNYGVKPQEIVGKNHNELTGDLWFPTIMDKVFEEKKRLCIEQITSLGKKIISTANPVLDNDGNIEMVVCMTEENFSNLDVRYNPKTKETSYLVNFDIDSKNSNDLHIKNKFMNQLFVIAKSAAKKDISIFISGESGTGKSMLARYIHENSNRSIGPFLSINCAAIPENLLESELFGYEPYAFSGANTKGKMGLIEAANNGTLFLDEIGELALPLQAKLLEVIENNTFIPIGGKKSKTVNVRFITATNQNLENKILDKSFREDLYWRLNVVNLKMPPLRHRPEDIDTLICDFLDHFNLSNNKNIKISNEALNTLHFYHWPGNIRQLKNTIERACIISDDDYIKVEDLPLEITNSVDTTYSKFETYDDFLESCSEYITKKAFEKFSSSRKLAEYLEISQTKANNLIKKYIKD